MLLYRNLTTNLPATTNLWITFHRPPRSRQNSRLALEYRTRCYAAVLVRQLARSAGGQPKRTRFVPCKA